MKIEELNDGCYRLTADYPHEQKLLGSLNKYISTITREKERQANIIITGRRGKGLDIRHIDIQIE